MTDSLAAEALFADAYAVALAREDERRRQRELAAYYDTSYPPSLTPPEPPEPETFTFGYREIAGSTSPTNSSFHAQANVTPAERRVAGPNERVVELGVYGDGTGLCTLAVYAYVGGVPTNRVGLPVVVAVGEDPDWYSTACDLALTEGVEYVVACDYWHGGPFDTDSWVIRYDDGVGDMLSTSGDAEADRLPPVWEGTFASSARVSFYAVSTNASPASS